MPADNESTSADWQVATAGYLESLQIPLLEGRMFTTADRTDSESVVIVNESFAKRYWPGESGLGHRIMSRGSDDPPWNRIVGVVGDVRHNGITAEIEEKWYRDVAADGQRFLMMKQEASGEEFDPNEIHIVLNWFEELKARVPIP